jgi:ABC-type sugar transport system ATPase subunit
MILDEPTRGVDVGAKAEIHALIGELTARGAAVLLISSELPEILGLADRIVVLREGRVAGEVTRADATQERLLRMMAGLAPPTNSESIALS